MTDDFCYLTTTGRRSGRAHRIEIWYVDAGDTWYLLSGGGDSSDWVKNLVVDPSVSVEAGETVRTARARVISDPEEAQRARSLVFAKYQPRSKDDLTTWRERSLPIALDVTG